MKEYKINELIVQLPEYLQRINSMPDDPVDSISFGSTTDNSENFIIMFPVNKENTMPINNKSIIIAELRKVLDEKQGIIKVDDGITANNTKYVYTIIKSEMEPSGVQYTLTFNLIKNDDALMIQGFFNEAGTTGLRDSIVYSMALENGVIKNMNEWVCDPYDKNYTHGLLMNFSENEKFDKMFPDFPLSILREFVNDIITNN